MPVEMPMVTIKVRSVPANLRNWRRHALARRACLHCSCAKRYKGHTPTSSRAALLRPVTLMLYDVAMTEAHQAQGT